VKKSKNMKRQKASLFILSFLILILAALVYINKSAINRFFFIYGWNFTYFDWQNPSGQKPSEFCLRLTDAALERTRHHVSYDPAYRQIGYPGGDVKPDRGVCSDVIIRSYRALGVDLQVLVHEDMKAHFDKYQQLWNLKAPNTNIDHRRVPNLMTFFKRQGAALPISNNPAQYLPGDVVAWNLGGGVTHIGIVANKASKKRREYQIVHNIGAGPKLEDKLFAWKIIGHFRYQTPSEVKSGAKSETGSPAASSK